MDPDPGGQLIRILPGHLKKYDVEYSGIKPLNVINILNFFSDHLINKKDPDPDPEGHLIMDP